MYVRTCRHTAWNLHTCTYKIATCITMHAYYVKQEYISITMFAPLCNLVAMTFPKPSFSRVSKPWTAPALFPLSLNFLISKRAFKFKTFLGAANTRQYSVVTGVLLWWLELYKQKEKKIIEKSKALRKHSIVNAFYNYVFTEYISWRHPFSQAAAHHLLTLVMSGVTASCKFTATFRAAGSYVL